LGETNSILGKKLNLVNGDFADCGDLYRLPTISSVCLAWMAARAAPPDPPPD
jgi:hypothetical protein